MAMSKKDFIALADALRPVVKRAEGTEHVADFVDTLADFCTRQNPRFNRARWFGYLREENGPNGGKIRGVCKHGFRSCEFCRVGV